MAEIPEELDEIGEVDPDLLNENDVEETPSTKPAKKRGTKKKGKKAEPAQAQAQTLPQRRRPFTETSVRTSMAKEDLQEVMNRYDWDSGDFDASIERIQPPTWQGRNCKGFIASFPHSIDEGFIEEHFGGGVYSIRVRGPNPRAGTSKGFLDGVRVKISGNPKVSSMDANMYQEGGIMLAKPQAGPLSNKQVREAQHAGQTAAAWEKDAVPNPDMDGSLVRKSFDLLTKREEKFSAENERLRREIVASAQKGGEQGGVASAEVFRILKEASDKAIDSERAAAERLQEADERHRQDFEKIVARMGNQQTGIPPEMLQSLTEQHRSEVNALHESKIQAVQQAQQRHESEINSLRDRSEREISTLQERMNEQTAQIRNEMQGRLDRELENARRETERERDLHRDELKRIKQEADKRFADAEKEAKARYDKLQEEDRARFDRSQEEWQRRFDQEKAAAANLLDRTTEEWKRRYDQQVAQSKTDREATERNAQMQSDHMKSLHETQTVQITQTLNSQLAQERSQHESTLAQLRAQQEAALSQMDTQQKAQITMQETSYQARIDSLNSELERTRSDLVAAQSKVTDQGDLATQAKRIREVNESLGAVFNLGGAAGAVPANLSDVDIEAKAEEPAGWWGKMMQFADTPVGESVFEIFKSMAVGASGMHPGAYPGMVPGAPGLPGVPPAYGPPPGHGGPPPGYGPPPANYGPPQQPPYSSQPQNVYADPEEEEFDSGQGVVTGRFVDEEPTPAGAAPEDPQMQPPGSVVMSNVPPVENSGFFGGVNIDDNRSSEVTPEEVERLHNQQSDQPSVPEQQPVQQNPAPQQQQPQPQPQQQAPVQPQQIPPEAIAQLKALVMGLEEAMKNGAPPEAVAQGIVQVAPKDQIMPFAQTPIEQLSADISNAFPESMLATYGGKKYLKAVQANILARLN